MALDEDDRQTEIVMPTSSAKRQSQIKRKFVGEMSSPIQINNGQIRPNLQILGKMPSPNKSTEDMETD